MTVCEIGGKIKLITASEYFKKAGNVIELLVVVGGFVVFLYRSFVEAGLIVQLIPFVVIIAKDGWQYYQILNEEQERKQTKARASEELAFENLEEPVQIEMETKHQQP